MSTIKTETLSTPSNSTVPVDTVVNGTAKAWVNFNGSGTVAISRAFNVSSITDIGTGYYTVNFTTAMPDANYALLGTSRLPSQNGVVVIVDMGDATRSTTVATIQTIGGTSFGLQDSAYNNVAIFR